MTDPPRPLRADAQRNRDALVEAATQALAKDELALEGVAREAGVGIGTLYRHFPTREALVEAAYRDELDALCGAAADLLHELPPDLALRAWMARFTDCIANNPGISDALKAVITTDDHPFAHSHRNMVAALATLLTAGVRAGTLRDDIDPADVLTALGGVSLATDEPDLRDQADPALDLILDGLRPR